MPLQKRKEYSMSLDVFNIFELLFILAVVCIVGGILIYDPQIRQEFKEIVKDMFIKMIKICKAVFKVLWKLIFLIIRIFYEEATGRPWPGKEVNEQIILTTEEVNQLMDRFGKHLYMFPVSKQYVPNSNGALWIQLTAIDYIESLRDLSVEQQKAIAVAIIKKFYLKARGFTPSVYILAISPQRLDFAIPLSEEGRKYLEKMIQTIREKEKSQEAKALEPLSEKVPPLEKDPAEDKDDPRL